MSIRFDVATDRITYQSANPPDPVLGFTLTCWAYISVQQAAQATMARLFNGSGTVVAFATDTDGVTGPGYYTFNGAVAVSGSMTVGAWRKLAISCSGTTGNVFSAPVSGATVTASGTIGGNDVPTGITLGGRGPSDGVEWWDGRLTYVRVWSRQLSQTEIETEWASSAAVSATNLWADWQLPTAGDLSDHSGNGRTLTAGSTAVTTEADPPVAVTPQDPPMNRARLTRASCW